MEPSWLESMQSSFSAHCNSGAAKSKTSTSSVDMKIFYPTFKSAFVNGKLKYGMSIHSTPHQPQVVAPDLTGAKRLPSYTYPRGWLTSLSNRLPPPSRAFPRSTKNRKPKIEIFGRWGRDH